MINERVFMNSQAANLNSVSNQKQIINGSLFSKLNIKNMQQQLEVSMPHATARSFFSHNPQESGQQGLPFLANKSKERSSGNSEKCLVLQNFLKTCDEMRHLPEPDYFKFHSNLTEKVRRHYVDMIIHFSAMIKVKTDVVFDAVNMFDRLFSTTQSSCTDKEIYLVALVSYYVACQNSKLTELTKNHLFKMGEGSFSEAELDEMIDYFQKTVNYGPRFTSPLQFFDAFACFFSFSPSEKYFGWLLLETALMDYKMIDCLPSLQAASAIFITAYVHGKKCDLQQEILPLLGHQEDVFHRVKDRMLEFFHRLRQHKPNSNVLLKFSKSNYYGVSTQEYINNVGRL